MTRRYMFSRCFKDDIHASNDKLVSAPPPAGLSFEPWRKQLEAEIAKVTPNYVCAITKRVDALSIKQRVRNRCRLQCARFYEVLERPGMLLKRQYPRRSHYAPMRLEVLKNALMYTITPARSTILNHRSKT